MNKHISYILIAVIFSSIFFFSCKRNDDECKTCKIIPNDTSLNVKFIDQNSAVELGVCNIWRKETSDPCELGQINASNDVLSQLDDYFKAKIPNVEEKATDFAIYLNKELEGSLTFNLNNIKALSRYYMKDGVVYHQFFHNKNNQFIELIELSGVIDIISFNALKYIHENIVDKSDHASRILISGKSNYDISSKTIVELLLKKAVNFVEKRQVNNGQLNNNSGNRNVPALGCGKPCPETVLNNWCDKSKICITKTGLDVICGSLFHTQILTQTNSWPIDSIRLAFDTTFQYSIRDNIFRGNEFGNKYMNYYYDLGAVYKNFITIPLAIQTARVVILLNKRMHYLDNPQVNAQLVLLDTQLKTAIQNLIIAYKATYNDAFTQSMFQDIQLDLNWGLNKPVSQIMIKFN
jgi:hypothetical protein